MKKQMAKGVKKMGMVGLGFALMTKDQIMSYMRELKQRAKMDAKEAKKLADDMVKKSKEEKKRLEKMMKENMKEYMDKIGVATKSDLKKLEKEIKQLKKARKK